MPKSSSYSDRLNDPRWQSKRLEIIERDNGRCQLCAATFPLEVHHLYYTKGRDPWDYGNHVLVTLCEKHHREADKARRTITRLFSFMPVGYLVNFTNKLAGRMVKCVSHHTEVFIAIDYLLSHQEIVASLVALARQDELAKETGVGAVKPAGSDSQFNTPFKVLSQTPIGQFAAAVGDSEEGGK